MSHVAHGPQKGLPDVPDGEQKIDFIQPYSNLFGHRKLGSGHFGVTYVSNLKRANQLPLKVVCKVSRKRSAAEDEWHEVQNLSNLKPHLLVVRLLGVCLDWRGGAIALLFEYHPGGTLAKLATAQHATPFDAGRADLLKIAYAMVCSVQHIHANGVLHRDIALRNFVLSQAGLPVLIDFGLSRNDVEYRSVGGKDIPWRLMPPEALSNELLSMPKSDVYMLGITYWQLYNGMKTPFPSAKSPRALSQELNALLEADPDATAPLSHREGMPPVLRDLVARMCSLCMERRPSASEVCSILAEHVPSDLHRFSHSSLNADSAHEDDDTTDLVSVLAKEYTRRRRAVLSAQARNARISHSSSVTSKSRSAHVGQVPPAHLQNPPHTPIDGSLNQENEHEVKSSEVSSKTPTRLDRLIDDNEHRDVEPSMSARGKVLLRNIESAGIDDPRQAARALRREQIEAHDLRDLTDEQLRRLFPKIGAFNRMKKFINREHSLTARGQLLRDDLQYLKLRNAEAVVRILRSEDIDMDLLAKLSDRELESLLVKVSGLGTQKLLRQYVKSLRKTRPRLPDSFREAYEANRVIFKSFFQLRDGWTKLHVASKQGKVLAIAKILRTRKPDPNTRTKTGKTALYIAVGYGKDSAVAMLLGDDRVDINAVDDEGDSALHFAVLSDVSLDVLSRLLKENCLDPNSRSSIQETPLLLAALNGNVAAVTMLLADDRVDVNAVDEAGYSALHCATFSDVSIDMMSRLLKDNRLSPNSRNSSQRTPLILAALNGNVSAVTMLLADDRVDVNAVDEAGYSALHEAAFSDVSIDVMSRLLKDNRLSPNSRNSSQRTPLILAALNGNVAAVTMLLADDRVDVNAVDEEGYSALHYAAFFDVSIDVMSRLLKDNRLSTNSRNCSQRTPLILATLNGNVAAMTVLLGDDRVDINAVDEDGDSALHYAASPDVSLDAIARLLKDNHLDPNSRNKKQQTPLLVAASEDNEAAVALLLGDDRVDTNAVDKDGDSALHYAACPDVSLDVMSRLLKDNRLDTNSRNKEQQTPLLRAALEGNDTAVAMLLGDHRVDINAVDKDGNSKTLCRIFQRLS